MADNQSVDTTESVGAWGKIMDVASKFGSGMKSIASGVSSKVKAWAEHLAEWVANRGRDGEKSADIEQETFAEEPVTPDVSDGVPEDKPDENKPDEPAAVFDEGESDKPENGSPDSGSPDTKPESGPDEQQDNSDNTIAKNVTPDDKADNKGSIRVVALCDMDFSDIDTSDISTYEIQHLTNMAAIKIAQEQSVMVNGQAVFDADKFSERLDSFTEYMGKYMYLRANTSSGIEFDNAEKSLHTLPDYEQNSHILSDIMSEQREFFDAVTEASDKGYTNNKPLYIKYPTAAFAGGDITYDDYIEYLDDREGFGADLIAKDDDKNRVSVGDMIPNENSRDAVAIKNTARLRFAKSMSKEGAFDMDALEEKMESFYDYADRCNQNGGQIANDGKYSTDIVDMYNSCTKDLAAFRDAENKKNEYAKTIPNGTGASETMRLFYEGYTDLDIAYAAGKIDRKTYESKMTSDLVGLSSDDFKTYVADKRSSQADADTVADGETEIQIDVQNSTLTF